MKHHRISTLAVALAMASFPATGFAQMGMAKNVTLHVNPRWNECAFQLDPSLTEAAWRQFTVEAALVTYFRPLADAKPMGAGNFEFALLQWETAIDDTESAWNDTFVHPNATHWLYEGSGLKFPGLMVRAGVSDKVDLGGYFTRNPESNYGVWGAQVQYNVINDTKRNWAASARGSLVSLFGPEDLQFRAIGMDLVASKEFVLSPSWVSVSPYAGVSSMVATSHEMTTAVRLADQFVSGSQGMVGAVVNISRVRLAAEYSSAQVRSRSIKIGVNF